MIYIIQIKFLPLVFLFTVSLIALGGLTNCRDKKQPETNQVNSSKLNVNVCDIISKQDIEKIFNVSIIKVRNTIQNSDLGAQTFVSQCAYEVKSSGYKSISIYLSYNGSVSNPKTFDGLVMANTHLLNKNDPEEKRMVNEMKKAFLSGSKINGLGDSGVWYNWSEVPSLLLFFNGHYKILINLIKFDYNKQTLKQVKDLAKKVITKV